MNFHDLRLPEFIEVFAVGQPEFTTSAIITASGREVRNLDSESARQKYKIKDCCLSDEQFAQFNSFFRARRGSNFAFRLRDHADYEVIGQKIAISDGKTMKIPLTKLYMDPILPYIRRITKPVQGSAKIYANNQLIDVQIDYDYGIILLHEALGAEVIITADFIFDVCMRFSNDSFSYSYCDDGSIGLADFELHEVLG